MEHILADPKFWKPELIEKHFHTYVCWTEFNDIVFTRSKSAQLMQEDIFRTLAKFWFHVFTYDTKFRLWNYLLPTVWAFITTKF